MKHRYTIHSSNKKIGAIVTLKKRICEKLIIKLDFTIAKSLQSKRAVFSITNPILNTF